MRVSVSEFNSVNHLVCQRKYSALFKFADELVIHVVIIDHDDDGLLSVACDKSIIITRKPS